MKETGLKLWGGETRGQVFLILMAPNIFFIGCLSHVHWPFGDTADDGFPGKRPYVCARSHAGGLAASKSMQRYGCDYRHSNVNKFQNKGFHHSIKNFPHEPF